MNKQDRTAKVEVIIDASPAKVWKGLTSAEQVKEYMMGAQVSSTWKKGSPITWSGEFQGKSYKDTGKVIRSEEGRHLVYSHESGGETHVVDITLHEHDGKTKLVLRQDNNASVEATRKAEQNWKGMMDGLKRVAER